jgi:hypothetical protein
MVATSDPNAPAENMSQKPDVSDLDHSNRAIRRGIEYAQRDLHDAGGVYNLDELREVLRDVSSQEIDQRVLDGSILEVRGANNQRQFPKMQFNDDGTVIVGLKSVYESFPSRSSWALLNFLVNPQDSLRGARPIDLLRSGATQEVVAAARQIGQQGY